MIAAQSWFVTTSFHLPFAKGPFRAFVISSPDPRRARLTRWPAKMSLRRPARKPIAPARTDYGRESFMRHRCQDIGLIDEQTTSRLYRNLNRRGWRKAEPLDDMLPAEQPRLLANAIQTIAADDPGHFDDICARTGLESGDIARYCGVDSDSLRVPDRALPLIRSKRDMTVLEG